MLRVFRLLELLSALRHWVKYCSCNYQIQGGAQAVGAAQMSRGRCASVDPSGPVLEVDDAFRDLHLRALLRLNQFHHLVLCAGFWPLSAFRRCPIDPCARQRCFRHRKPSMAYVQPRHNSAGRVCFPLQRSGRQSDYPAHFVEPRRCHKNKRRVRMALHYTHFNRLSRVRSWQRRCWRAP